MQAGGWAAFVAERSAELVLRTGEHVVLTGISTAVAIAVGVPLGVIAWRTARLRAPLLGTVGVLQTVPSLAMLAILLALFNRIGVLPALVALILYALLPIVRNTVTGLEGVPADQSEAARGIGMTARQELWLVRLPLARPVIIAGIRTAAVVGVGIATLSAFIGAGGLGQFINRGLALSETRLILLGAIPAALLAILVDLTVAAVGWGLRPMRQSERRTPKAKLKPLSLAVPLPLVLFGVVALTGGAGGAGEQPGDTRDRVIRIASKNFTEQLLIGEIMAQMIEQRTDLTVQRRFNLGGTMICHGALVSGGVDLYAEYTGTGLTTILKQDVVTDPDDALRLVRREYRERFDVAWLRPFGFNNTYAIAVRGADADRYNWRSISDLAREAGTLRAGFTAEFAERRDGYAALRARYGFAFGEVRDLDPALMYDAVGGGGVDVIAAFATDGRIGPYGLRLLTDDRRAFPPYHAVPVVRAEALRAHPELRAALAPLSGLLDDAAMRRLNYQVDVQKRSVKAVAREFLQMKGLID